MTSSACCGLQSSEYTGLRLPFRGVKAESAMSVRASAGRIPMRHEVRTGHGVEKERLIHRTRRSWWRIFSSSELSSTNYALQQRDGDMASPMTPHGNAGTAAPGVSRSDDGAADGAADDAEGWALTANHASRSDTSNLSVVARP